MCSKCLAILNALEANRVMLSFQLSEGNFAARVSDAIISVCERNRKMGTQQQATADALAVTAVAGPDVIVKQ